MAKKVTTLFLIEANEIREKNDGVWKTLKRRGFWNSYGDFVPAGEADIYSSERDAKQVLKGDLGDAEDPRHKAARPEIVKFVRQ